jgi:hypothetical protein
MKLANLRQSERRLAPPSVTKGAAASVTAVGCFRTTTRTRA